MAADPVFTLTRILGVNNTDPPTAIGDNQCVTGMNVEFDKSSLGERRNGCTDVDLPASITGNANIQAITFLHRNLPTQDETASELWVMGQHLTTQNVVMSRKTTSWTDATFTDAVEVTGAQGFQVQAQTLHGKMFIAYPSVGAIDRLHVVDQNGTAVRRTGLAEPAAPTGANTGTPGTAFTGTRYYRVRYTVQVGGDTRLRSEPSDSLTFAPSGTGTAARITKPASISEGETHWELEASTDNANFYVIATTAVGTTTYDDSTLYANGYAASFVLSEDIGDYALIHSGKFLAADEDRLVVGGSWEDTALASRVSWTPVYADPGDGNDERIPTDTTNYLDLDGFEGGPLTHLSNPVNGAIWAFKRSHTYKLVRTGQRSRAYHAYNLSKTLGALPGSVVEGVDQYGMPCLYALDPEVGPWRTGGARLITYAGQDILTTWRTVNANAIVACRGLYYPDSRQVHWWLATSSADYPNLKLVLQTTHTREGDDGIRNGFSMANGKIATAYAACLYAENIDTGAARSLTLRPFIGVTSGNGYVLRCDTGSDDNGTAFAAQVVTKPYILGNLLQKFKVLATAILAKAHATADLKVTLIRDFGLEEPRMVETTLSATASETHVIKQLRDLTGSQLYALQVEFEDVAAPTGQWQLNRMDMRLSKEESG
jgi:hypothetical protein